MPSRSVATEMLSGSAADRGGSRPGSWHRVLGHISEFLSPSDLLRLSQASMGAYHSLVAAGAWGAAASTALGIRDRAVALSVAAQATSRAGSGFVRLDGDGPKPRHSLGLVALPGAGGTDTIVAAFGDACGQLADDVWVGRAPTLVPAPRADVAAAVPPPPPSLPAAWTSPWQLHCPGGLPIAGPPALPGSADGGARLEVLIAEGAALPSAPLGRASHSLLPGAGQGGASADVVSIGGEITVSAAALEAVAAAAAGVEARAALLADLHTAAAGSQAAAGGSGATADECAVTAIAGAAGPGLVAMPAAACDAAASVLVRERAPIADAEAARIGRARVAAMAAAAATPSRPAALAAGVAGASGRSAVRPRPPAPRDVRSDGSSAVELRGGLPPGFLARAPRSVPPPPADVGAIRLAELRAMSSRALLGAEETEVAALREALEDAALQWAVPAVRAALCGVDPGAGLAAAADEAAGESAAARGIAAAMRLFPRLCTGEVLCYRLLGRSDAAAGGLPTVAAWCAAVQRGDGPPALAGRAHSTAGRSVVLAGGHRYRIRGRLVRRGPLDWAAVDCSSEAERTARVDVATLTGPGGDDGRPVLTWHRLAGAERPALLLPVTGAGAAGAVPWGTGGVSMLVFGGYQGRRCVADVSAVTVGRRGADGSVTVSVEPVRAAGGPCRRQDSAVVRVGASVVVFGGADVMSIGDAWELRGLARGEGGGLSARWKRLILRGLAAPRAGVPEPLSGSSAVATSHGGFVVFGGERCDRGRSVEHVAALHAWAPCACVPR